LASIAQDVFHGIRGLAMDSDMSDLQTSAVAAKSHPRSVETPQTAEPTSENRWVFHARSLGMADAASCSAFQQELHGIVRTLQPEVLVEIGYPAGQNHRLLREVFQALARRLDPVMAACVWAAAGEGGGGAVPSGSLH
jgi:hypothetical protein